MPLTLRPLDKASAPAWDAFVEAMPLGTFCHRAGWANAIQNVLRHRLFYTYAERDGSIVGVLPLAQMKTLLFGNTLTSSPFCVYGGPLAADTDRRLGRAGLGCVMWLFVVGACYSTVPDTELALVLLGVASAQHELGQRAEERATLERYLQIGRAHV